MKRLFGTDGIRGLANSELSPILAYSVGEALAELLYGSSCKKPVILVGMDTRESSPELCDSICDGIRDGGGRAIRIGVCATPTVAYLLVKHRLDAGVMISASHNPYEYNGIKIFGNNGYKLSDELERDIEERVKKGPPQITPSYAREQYIDHIMSTVDVSLDGLKIAIDCANGSASVTAKEIFTRLGADCYLISDTPDGKNINKSCGSTNLAALKNKVVCDGLDLGIAFDGDADRCIAVDERGEEVDGDQILAILALALKDKGRLRNNTVVGTIVTNLGLNRFCKEHKIDFRATPVGDKFVLEEINSGNYSLGGEQSGHIIIPELSTTGDGQLTALALLSEIKKSGKSLSTLAGVMNKYPQITINIDADQKDKESFKNDEKIKKEIEGQRELLGDDGRIIVRPSGTENLIRITVECINGRRAAEIADSLATIIKQRLYDLNGTVRQ